MYRIKILREAKGWSQAQLGEKVGVTASAVSYWENGVRDPGVETLRKLAAVLGTDMNYLFGQIEPREEETWRKF